VRLSKSSIVTAAFVAAVIGLLIHLLVARSDHGDVSMHGAANQKIATGGMRPDTPAGARLQDVVFESESKSHPSEHAQVRDVPLVIDDLTDVGKARSAVELLRALAHVDAGTDLLDFAAKTAVICAEIVSASRRALNPPRDEIEAIHRQAIAGLAAGFCRPSSDFESLMRAANERLLRHLTEGVGADDARNAIARLESLESEWAEIAERGVTALDVAAVAREVLNSRNLPEIEMILALTLMRKGPNVGMVYWPEALSWLGAGLYQAHEASQLPTIVGAILACRDGNPYCSPTGPWTLNRCAVGWQNCRPGANLLDVMRDRYSAFEWRIAEHYANDLLRHGLPPGSGPGRR
jgi:hypothetical protein